MKPFADGLGRRPRRCSRPGSGLPDGSACGMPRLVEQLDAAPERQDRLAVPVLVLHELERRGRRPRSVRTASPPSGRTTRVEEHRRRRLEADVDLERLAARPMRPRRARADEPRHRACRGQPRRRAPAAARRRRRRRRGCATRRVRMLPSPGRANSDSAGDAVTSGVTSASQHLRHRRRQLAGCRGPSATASASSASTFSRPETMRSRIAGVCTRDSSKRNALMMCAFSTGVWLFQNSVRLRVVVGEPLGLAAHLVRRRRRAAPGTRRSPPRRPGTDSRRRASSARRTTRPRWIAWRCMPSRWLLCTCATGALIGISWKFGPPSREICVST